VAAVVQMPPQELGEMAQVP